MAASQILGPHRANKSHQASDLERTPAILCCIPRKSRTHAILLARGEGHCYLLRADNTQCSAQAHSYLGSLIGAIVQVRMSLHFRNSVSMVLTGRGSLGYCSRFVCRCVLPRRHSDSPIWRSNGPSRCRQPIAFLAAYCASVFRSAGLSLVLLFTSVHTVRVTQIYSHSFLLSSANICRRISSTRIGEKMQRGRCLLGCRYIITYYTIVAIIKREKHDTSSGEDMKNRNMKTVQDDDWA